MDFSKFIINEIQTQRGGVSWRTSIERFVSISLLSESKRTPEESLELETLRKTLMIEYNRVCSI